MPLRIFFLVFSLVLLLLFLPAVCQAESKIMVVSDLHYLAPELYEGSQLFLNALEKGDGKITQEGDTLLSALRKEVKAIGPDALVVTGDLSFNGEKLSHERLAAFFSLVEADGTPVYVIPGNHDINVQMPIAFLENGFATAKNVTEEEFASIYQPFLLPPEGGENANFSCHAELKDDLWLAFVDAACYKDQAQVFGLYTKDHDDWLKGVLEKARQKGARVITFTHHSLIPHTRFSMESYLMSGHEAMMETLVSGGCALNLSGHLHAQHVAREGSFVDAATGAFCLSPHRYSLITVGDDGKITYQALSLRADFLPEGFLPMSRDWFLRISREKTRASLAQMDIPGDDLESMLDYAAAFHWSYFAGLVRKDDPSWVESPGYLLWKEKDLSSMTDLLLDECQYDSLFFQIGPAAP